MYVLIFYDMMTSSNALRWRHNELDGVSNHQPHGCLLNRLFRRRSKKTSKLRVTGLCVGNSPGPVNSPHKWPVTRKMFPFDDVIMEVFSALLAICMGNSPVTGEFPTQRPVMQSFDVFFDMCLNKRLSKQLWGWWFETPSCPSWCHCNDLFKYVVVQISQISEFNWCIAI